MQRRLPPEQKTTLGQHIEVFLLPNGCAGLQSIDADMANLCFVFGVTTFQTLGATFGAALAHLRQLIPPLDARLRGATPVGTTPASVAGLPYGHVCRASDCAGGLYRVGDQLAVIPPFTGEGIALALRTARLAPEAIMAGVPSRDFVATARRELRWPMRVAASLETMSRRQLLARAALSFCSMRRRAARARPSDPAAGQDRRCSMPRCNPAMRLISLGWRQINQSAPARDRRRVAALPQGETCAAPPAQALSGRLPNHWGEVRGSPSRPNPVVARLGLAHAP
jgi:hypothetical protein